MLKVTLKHVTYLQLPHVNTKLLIMDTIGLLILIWRPFGMANIALHRVTNLHIGSNSI